MCRLFAQIAKAEQNAFCFLIQSRFSLLAQSDWDKKHLQKDGWGIAHLPMANGEWQIVKSEKPIFKEKEKFKKIAKLSKSKIILAHIRHASNPKKFSRKELIGIQNCQPFVYKNLAFAHNGTLNIPDAVADVLGDYKERICGTNDSEVLFWLFVKTYCLIVGEKKKRGNPHFWKKVFQKMIAQIETLWRGIPAEKRKFARPFRGLNCIASDGKSLAAFCFYEKPEGKSLCGQNRPYFEMCYNIFTDRIVVASEPLDDSNGWRPIPNKHLFVVNDRMRGVHLPFVMGGGVG